MSAERTAGEAALAFRSVTKRFGATRALDGFDLEVRRGELFGLVGQNGAGKTTLLKCLLDFCEPDSGDIRIFGVASRATAARRHLAYLPERFILRITSPGATSSATWLRCTVTLTTSSV